MPSPALPLHRSHLDPVFALRAQQDHRRCARELAGSRSAYSSDPVFALRAQQDHRRCARELAGSRSAYSSDPVAVIHTVDGSHGAQDGTEVPRVGHLERELR